MIDTSKITTENITKEQLMQIALDDPRWIIERAFWVIDKEKERVPFLFNNPQNIFYDERTSRDDILKAGQLGLSTEILAILTVKFLLVPNSWSVSISHEDNATRRLFEKVEYFLENLPVWLKPFYIPGKTSQGDITNEAMHSKFYIGTAGARAFGRGDTIHYAHLSETSRWPGYGRLMTGIIRAVPLNDPNTWIVKETTANGEGTLHHEEYVRAKDGQSEFKAHFIPFFANPEYRITNTGLNFAMLTPEEKRLLTRFPQENAKQNKGWVDIEALAWRRAMIRTLNAEAGINPEDLFRQEFPVDDQEAFLSTGNPVFSTEKIQNYKSRARPPIAVGNLVGAQGKYTLQEEKNGWLQLWDFPALGDQFVIFADVGQYSDFCVATVVDKKTWNVIAKFRANIQSHAFGNILYQLGMFFNQALLAVEANNMGQSTIDRLVDLKYPNLYMRQRTDAKTNVVSNVYGWQTTEKTKSQMIGHMQDIINSEEADIPDIEILDEFSSFIRTDSGGMEAAPGRHDDQVIATCGAYYVLKLKPFVSLAPQTNVVRKRVQKYKKFRGGKLNFRRAH